MWSVVHSVVEAAVLRAGGITVLPLVLGPSTAADVGEGARPGCSCDGGLTDYGYGGRGRSKQRGVLSGPFKG